MRFKILSRSLIAVVGCFAFTGAVTDAFAQSSSLFSGGSTATGSSNGLGMANTGTSFQSSSFPSSTFPAGGATATGQQGLGTGTQGAGGQQAQLLGLNNGTNLLGTGLAPGQNPNGQTGQNGMMNNRQGMQNRNNANRRTGQNRNQANQTGANNANQQGRTIRPQLVIAFDYGRPAAEKTQTAISTRFSKLASKTQFKDIQVEVDGDVVILRGQVDTERSGKVAAVLAKMEPGVKEVRNELTVAEPKPQPSE